MKSTIKNLKLMQSTTEEISKTITKAIIQGAEVDTHLPEEVKGDPQTTMVEAIEEHHQPIKAKEHTGETVVTKAKVTEGAKIKTMVEAMIRTIVNIARNQATL
jgi:hypothetical protein